MPRSAESGADQPLVSAAWLAERRHDPAVVILDASWYLPAMGRDADAEFRQAHIPGARRFDLDQIRDTASPLPHMLPGAADFARAMERLGIRPTDHVVCYDGSSVHLSAARAWWMFRAFGHQQVSVLDGGMRAWASETRPVMTSTTPHPPSGYPVPGGPAMLSCGAGDIRRIVAGEVVAQIVDARAADRFRGEAPEPRPGLRAGHIPGSRNLPFTECTDPVTGRFRSADDLLARFSAIGVDLRQPVVASCGSGVTACVLALAVEVVRAAGHPVGDPVTVYDGSWAEWGALPEG